MKSASLALAALLILMQSSQGAAPPAGDPLEALSWFVGTWEAEIKASDGRAMRVETKFEWAEHGRALKYSIHFHSGDGSVAQYEGLYFYHPAKKHIAMIQVDRSGNVTESVASLNGDTMEQENQATTADGTTRPQRVRAVRMGDDAFEFTALVQRDGEWVQGISLTYKRQRAGVK